MGKWFELDEEEVKSGIETNDEYASFESRSLDSGIYDVRIDEVYIETRDSGSEFIQFNFSTSDEKVMYWNDVNTLLKDTSGNFGYDKKLKDGSTKKIPYSGALNIKRICDVVKIDFKKLDPRPVKIEKFNKEVTVKMFTELVGKKIKVAVQKYENEYNGDITIKSSVIKIMDLDGNYKGENFVEKMEKYLENHPLKKFKEKQTNKKKGDSGKGSEAANSW